MKISKEFKVGVLAVVTLVALYMGVNFLRGIDFFSSSNTYYVVYDDIGGLTVSNPVMINGLSVGRVSKIRILQSRKNQLLVELDVDKEIVLGDKTKAVLINSDLLGSKAILLEVGPLTNKLTKGDTLIPAVDEGLAQLLREKSVPIADNLNDVTRKLSLFLDKLNDKEGEVELTLKEVKVATQQLSYAIRENRGSFRKISDNLAVTTAAFNDKETGIKPLMENMNGLTDSLQAMKLAETTANLNDALISLNRTLEAINKGEGTLGRLAKDDSLYSNMNASAEALAILLEDLQENPKRYVHFSVFGRKDKKGKEEDDEAVIREELEEDNEQEMK